MLFGRVWVYSLDLVQLPLRLLRRANNGIGTLVTDLQKYLYVDFVIHSSGCVFYVRTLAQVEFEALFWLSNLLNLLDVLLSGERVFSWHFDLDIEVILPFSYYHASDGVYFALCNQLSP